MRECENVSTWLCCGLSQVASLVEQGKLKVNIDQVFGLEDIAPCLKFGTEDSHWSGSVYETFNAPAFLF